MIGSVAGGAVMLQAMSELGVAGESGYQGPIRLEGDPKGTSVLILGAGLAGLCAAYELRKAGYRVKVLEYNSRPGGRNWTLYGGDTYTELGGSPQHVEFEKGLYLNPGPWRIPHSHRAVLDYCRMLKVRLEPFTQVNYDAYVHSSGAFGGKPQRYRCVEADFNGHVAELLGKAAHQGRLDDALTAEDREILVQALRRWGALDASYQYSKGLPSSDRRGFDVDPGGGLAPPPSPSTPLAFTDLLRSGLWGAISAGHGYDMQSTLFQPVGGMGMIGKAFGALLEEVIQYEAKVTEIRQRPDGVTVGYRHARKGGPVEHARADWCVCTIPASILSQIPLDAGAPLQNAIDAISYEAASKVGLQFRRRFWEQDEAIYGGITYTDLPINSIGYPSSGYLDEGPGVLLGAYLFGNWGLPFSALSAEERVRQAVEYGAQIHPQYREEFQHGVSVTWHRVPWTLGCSGRWTESLRAQHYDNLCAIDGRIVLAGEHASRLPAWQEGALLSALDAIQRLHARVLQSATG
jgi:monoamine oxidase